ncbi:DUF2779 domain-containing protein [Pseudopelagicola sp. nBUS_20]|uniref:DUF2779 domain-containing protein n=1 Tax=Pseudopelagicola sp. nBUS_20 TaxID=3395317 RepID=UPI003EB70282
MQISKSDYMLFLRHPAWLWIKKHQKHLLPPIDPSLQSRFDEGHAFEPYAEALFPNLVRLGFSDFSSYQSLTTLTSETWQAGAKAVAQGRYEDGQITCITDIVSRNGDGYVLTEIKSSTSAKIEHTFDLAFQRLVLEGAGMPILRCEVAHVNRSFRKNGQIAPEELVTITDISEEVENQIENTRRWVDQALSVAKSNTMPDPAPERARLKSYHEWLEIRAKITPTLCPESIHLLPFINAKQASALIKEGITSIDDVDDPTILSKSTRRYLTSRSQGSQIVDHDALDRFLGEITYPIYYLDYETSQSLLPQWEGTRPYQQVPFQYSLHVQREPDGDIEHHEYLHREESNPIPALLKNLRKDIGDVGSILVWYEPFEKTRNTEMAEAFPEHKAFLFNLNERVIDLMQPFSDQTITDPAFMGSSSIKKVLPALVPELAYDDLDIKEGASASRLWKEVTMINPEAQERLKVYANLVDYCTRDTWAMVAIHGVMKEM